MAPYGVAGRQWARRLRAGGRIGLIVAWTGLSLGIQAVLVRLPGARLGQGKVVFARFYWWVVSRILGIGVRVIGHNAAGARPVLYVANHSSWLDIVVLGAQLHACFVSKNDVENWPLVGTVARLGRTVFVSRSRGATGREGNVMRDRLNAGDNLLLFPEGTSSDGARVLPFRSAFFAFGENGPVQRQAPDQAQDQAQDQAPWVQPVSVAYDRLGGLPVLRGNRPILAWYGDMDLAPHLWTVAGWSGLRVTVLLHPPMDPKTYASRKVLARVAEERVAAGAAALRQNREYPGADAGCS